MGYFLLWPEHLVICATVILHWPRDVETSRRRQISCHSIAMAVDHTSSLRGGSYLFIYLFVDVSSHQRLYSFTDVDVDPH